MPASLDDTAPVHDEHEIRTLDRRQPVRDHERRPSREQALQAVLHGGLRHAVQMRGGLVEDQDPRILEHRASHRDPLLLPAAEPVAALTDGGGQSLGKAGDDVVEVRVANRIGEIGLVGRP